MKKNEVRAYFKRAFKKPDMTDTEIAQKLGTSKGNFSRFDEELSREQRAWVLEWLWKNKKATPPELRAS